MVRLLKPTFAAALLWAAFPAPAGAELVFFANGRHLSVSAHRVDGDSLVLVLRGGGEIVCERSLVASIAPDEVPYPEPVSAEAPPAAAAPLPAVPYGDLIDTAAARYGIDPGLVRAIIQVESAYRPDARSPKGAMGLMQLMPRTARQYAVRNPYDPRSNIEAGVMHLKSLLRRFDLSVALAAYNAGEAAVERFGGIPPYQETREYVSRVLGLLRSVRPA
jgi:soluble lytic murein transglycosylase-like protein